MQEPSIFTKIIRGELPSHKVYEDEKTLAFLDIHPIAPGHVLVVPKSQVDRIEDLAPKDYTALMQTVNKVMKRVVSVYGSEFRACMKVEGFMVPHAHVLVVPCRTAAEFWAEQDVHAEPDHAALAKVAEQLRFS